MTDYYVELGRRVRLLREKAGWTQAQLAERIGVQAPAVSRFEGGAKRVTLETLRRIAHVFRVSPADILRETDAVPTPRPFIPPPRTGRKLPPQKDLAALQHAYMSMSPKLRVLTLSIVENLARTAGKKQR